MQICLVGLLLFLLNPDPTNLISCPESATTDVIPNTLLRLYKAAAETAAEVLYATGLTTDPSSAPPATGGTG